MVNFELSFPQGTNRPDAFTWYNSFLDGYQIKGYEKLIEKEEYAEKASTLEDKDGLLVRKFDPSIRSSNVKWLIKKPEFKPLFETIAERVLQANNEFWKFDLHSMHEDIQYTEYHAKDKGHYDWHMDLGPGHACYRKLSITINLSDPNDYEGGTLEFNVGNKTKTYAPKTKGAIIIFPSFLLHKVNPVTKGVRKSLVTWVGGKPFK